MRVARIIAAATICLFLASAELLFAVSAKPGLFDKTGYCKTTGAYLPRSYDAWDEPEPLKAPVVGIRKAIVILVEFSDNRADRVHHPTSAYETLLFDSTGAVPTGSMHEYYQEVSYGQFFLTGVVTDWFVLPQTNSYYAGEGFGRGEWPQNRRRLAYDAVVMADPHVDFSQFDGDGDGFVDALFIVHAGPGGEETGDSTDIWSHKWRIPANEDGTGDGYMTDDGVRAYSYAMEPEEDAEGNLITIGVFCHEYGHVLGLPDLYDRDYSSEGIGNWGLMAGGSWGGDGHSPELPVHFCAWSKEQLGWLTPLVVTDNVLAQPVSTVEQSPEAYKLWTDGLPGDEYFLIVNRQKIGFDVNLYNSGLLIWHVDLSVETQNDDEGHKLVDLEEADGRNDLDKGGGRGDDGDPYPGSANNRTFDLFSSPNSRTCVGDLSQVAVFNISDSQPTMTVDMEIRTDYPILIYDDAVIIDDDGNGNGKPDPGETVDVVVSISNYGPGATAITGKLSTPDPSIHFLVDQTAFSDIPFNSSGDNSASPFSFSVDEAASVHYAYLTLDMWCEEGVDTAQFTFRLVVGHPTLLLVDDDYDPVPSEWGYDVEAYYCASLDSAGEIFDHWDSEREDDSPDSALLETYEIVVWFTGDAEPTLTAEDQANLAAFLDDGGRLFISGQDIATELHSSPFLSDYLHAEWMADDSEEEFVYSVAGDPISSGVNFVFISGEEGANNQASPDAIARTPESSTVFTFQPSGRAAGIKYSGEHKVVYFAFGFEAIVSPVKDSEVERGAIMEKVINWLRVEPARGDVNEDGLVNILDVVAAVNIILGIIQPASSQLWAVDCNGDGIVNIVDAIGIVNLVLGIGTCQPTASRTQLTPEAMEFFASLEPHFSSEDFARLMALLRMETRLPGQYNLTQNYPNPFNPVTRIHYTLAVTGDGELVNSPIPTTLKVFNLLGQEVISLVDEVKEPGSYTATWDGRDRFGSEVASGVYFYQLKVGEFCATKRMVLMK